MYKISSNNICYRQGRWPKYWYRIGNEKTILVDPQCPEVKNAIDPSPAQEAEHIPTSLWGPYLLSNLYGHSRHVTSMTLIKMSSHITKMLFLNVIKMIMKVISKTLSSSPQVLDLAKPTGNHVNSIFCLFSEMYNFTTQNMGKQRTAQRATSISYL